MPRFLSLALAAGFFMPSVAQAQQCDERDKVIEYLGEKYQESVSWVGIVPGNRVIELLTAPSGTFTIIINPEPGIACIFATGEGAREVKTQLKGRGA